jgi:hypothetical protein
MPFCFSLDESHNTLFVFGINNAENSIQPFFIFFCTHTNKFIHSFIRVTMMTVRLMEKLELNMKKVEMKKVAIYDNTLLSLPFFKVQ